MNVFPRETSHFTSDWTDRVVVINNLSEPREKKLVVKFNYDVIHFWTWSDRGPAHMGKTFCEYANVPNFLRLVCTCRHGFRILKIVFFENYFQSGGTVTQLVEQTAFERKQVTVREKGCNSWCPAWPLGPGLSATVGLVWCQPHTLTGQTVTPKVSDVRRQILLL